MSQTSWFRKLERVYNHVETLKNFFFLPYIYTTLYHGIKIFSLYIKRMLTHLMHATSSCTIFSHFFCFHAITLHVAFIRHFHKRKLWFYRKFGFAIGTCSLIKDGLSHIFYLTLYHAIPRYTTMETG